MIVERWADEQCSLPVTDHWRGRLHADVVQSSLSCWDRGLGTVYSNIPVDDEVVPVPVGRVDREKDEVYSLTTVYTKWSKCSLIKNLIWPELSLHHPRIVAFRSNTWNRIWQLWQVNHLIEYLIVAIRSNTWNCIWMTTLPGKSFNRVFVIRSWITQLPCLSLRH